MFNPADLALAKRRLPLPLLWERLGLPGKPGRSCRCPLHQDASNSGSVWQRADGTWAFKCFAGCGVFDEPDLLARVRGVPLPIAIAEFKKLADLPSPPVPKPAAARPARPPLHVGTDDELTQLAQLRRLALGGLRLASTRGLLRFGLCYGQRSWFVTDPVVANAQARRLDGQAWRQGAKALTLPGSHASRPLGARVAAPFPIVLFCEGGPDLLAAHAVIVAEGREVDTAAVAMLGASFTIPETELPLFAGKRVRFFTHADAPGRASVQRWARQLACVAACVDAVDLTGLRQTDGSPVKDLNDLTSIHPDDFEAHHALRSLVPPH